MVESGEAELLVLYGMREFSELSTLSGILEGKVGLFLFLIGDVGMKSGFMLLFKSGLCAFQGTQQSRYSP